MKKDLLLERVFNEKNTNFIVKEYPMTDHENELLKLVLNYIDTLKHTLTSEQQRRIKKTIINIFKYA